MSTTVTYKGQTLTTVENQTKTLQTAGTWVEGDFTLTDVTQGGGVVPTGFVEEYSVTNETAIIASNNAEQFIKSICPSLDDTTDYNLYVFIVTNNKIGNRAGIYAVWQRTGSSGRVVQFARMNSDGSIRWGATGFDFYVAAGAVTHVLKFNSLLGEETWS
jgi:hypothetical protein